MIKILLKMKVRLVWMAKDLTISNEGPLLQLGELQNIIQDNLLLQTAVINTDEKKKKVKLKSCLMKPSHLVICWWWATANHDQMSLGCAAYTKSSCIIKILLLFPPFLFLRLGEHSYYFYFCHCLYNFYHFAWIVFLLPWFPHGPQSSALLRLSFQ